MSFRGNGKISRYAWGNDYHDILISRLMELIGYIKSRIPSAQGLCYTDTGPVMENVDRDGEVDLYKFPVPFLHEEDGGRYIACCILIKFGVFSHCNYI